MEVVGVSIGDWDGLTQIADVDGGTSPEHCNDVLVMLMAGRAAEELVLGSPSAGAGGAPGSDLSHATELAKKMELRFGFGEYGPVFLPDGAHDPLTTVPGLFIAVKNRLERALAAAAELLEQNRAALDAVADALCRSGYLSAGEVSELVGRIDGRTEMIA
jgi:ATP-dependent Zn protease